MDIHVKRATSEDIKNIVNNRMEFLMQAKKRYPSDEFRIATMNYLYEHINDDSLICYLAFNNEQIVSSVIVCIYSVIPKPSNISGKIGYVFNVYTVQELRGQGLATKLLNTVIDEARRTGVGELYLSTTDDGKGIYEKLQFQHLDEAMCLKLV